MDFSEPDLSQRDETPCFLVENSQLETQRETECSDGEEDVTFKQKMLARLAALRDKSSSPVMEVELMSNGHKCHIAMATGSAGEPGGPQQPGTSGTSTAGPSSGGQGGGAEDDGSGGAEQGGGGGDAGGGGDGGDDDDDDDDNDEEEEEGDDSHHEEEAETSTSTPQSSGNSSGSRSSLPGLVRPTPSVVTPRKVIPLHEIQQSEGEMSAVSETEGRHEAVPGSESEGLDGLSEASTALVTDTEMSPPRKTEPRLTSPGPSKLSGSSSSGSVQLQSSTISTISSLTSSSSGSSHTETPLKKSPRKTPTKSPRKDAQHLTVPDADKVKTSPVKGKTKSPKKSPHKSPRKAGQAKESPMKARRRLGEAEFSAARDTEEKPEDTKPEGGGSGSSGASNKIHEHTSGEVRMEMQIAVEDQPISVPDSQPAGGPDSPIQLSSQEDMFVQDIHNPQEEHILSTPAENLGCLQLSGEPMLVQDTSLSSEGGSETVISPSPEAYGHTSRIIPSSPTEETDHPVEVAEDPAVPSSQGSPHDTSPSVEVISHPWQPSEPQWSEELLPSGPDENSGDHKRPMEMTRKSSNQTPSLQLQLPDTELPGDETTSQGASSQADAAVQAKQTKAEGLKDDKEEITISSQGIQKGRRSERQELNQAVEFLKGMFPSLDKDILISVYEAQNRSLEAAAEQLLEMSQGDGAIGLSVEMEEDVQPLQNPATVTVRMPRVERPEDVATTSRGDTAQKKRVSLWELASTSKDNLQTPYSQVEVIEGDTNKGKETLGKSDEDEKQAKAETVTVKECEHKSVSGEGNIAEHEEDAEENWALHFTPSLDDSQSQNLQSRVGELIGDLHQATESELSASQLLFVPQNQPTGPAPTEHSKQERKGGEDAEEISDDKKEADISAEEKDGSKEDEDSAGPSKPPKEDSSVEVILCDTEKEESQGENKATPTVQPTGSEFSAPFQLALPKDGGLFRPIATTPPLMKPTRPRLPRHSTPLPDHTDSPSDTTPTSAVTSAATSPEGNGSAFADPGSSGLQDPTTSANRGAQAEEGPPLQMRMEAVLESQSGHTQEENQQALFQLQKPPELDAAQLKAIKESPTKRPSLFTRVREKVQARHEEQDSSREDDEPQPADSEDLFEPASSSRKAGKKGKSLKRRKIQVLDTEESDVPAEKSEEPLHGEVESKISETELMDLEEGVEIKHTCGLKQEEVKEPGTQEEAKPVMTKAICQSPEGEESSDGRSEQKEEPSETVPKLQAMPSDADTLEYWRSSEEGEQMAGEQIPDERGEGDVEGQRHGVSSNEHAQSMKPTRRSLATAQTVSTPDISESDKTASITEDPKTPEKAPEEEKDPYKFSSQVSPIVDRRTRRRLVAEGVDSPPASVTTWAGLSEQPASATRVVGLQVDTQPAPGKGLKRKKTRKDTQRKPKKLRTHGGGASPSGRGSTLGDQGTSRDPGKPTAGDGGEEEEGGEDERMSGDGDEDGEDGDPPHKIDEEQDTESPGGEEELVRETTVTTITRTVVMRHIVEKLKRGQKIVSWKNFEETDDPVEDISENVSISPTISRTGSSLTSGELADVSSLSTSASKSSVASPSGLSKSLSSPSLSRTSSSGPSMPSLERTSSSQSKSSSSSPGTGGARDREGFTRPVGSPRRRRSGVGTQLLGQQSKVTEFQRLEVSEAATQTEVEPSKSPTEGEDREKGQGVSGGDGKEQERQPSKRRKSSNRRQTGKESVHEEEPDRETESGRVLRSGQAVEPSLGVQKRSDSTGRDTGRRGRRRTAGPSGGDDSDKADKDPAESAHAVEPSTGRSPRRGGPRGRSRGSPRGRGRRGGASADRRSLSSEKGSRTPQVRRGGRRTSSAAASSRSSRGQESEEQSSESSEERAGTPEIPYQGVQQRLSGTSEIPQAETTRESMSSDSGGSEPREGARVMALLVSDKHWYPGVIIKTLKNDRYLVRFEDEDESNARPREIAARNMMVVSRLPVNTAVLASVEKVQDRVYAPGIVRGYHRSQETGAEEYLVEFNDGSTVRAPHANVILNPEQAAAFRAQGAQVSEVSASVSLDNLVIGKRKRPGSVAEFKTPEKGKTVKNTEYSSGGTSSSITSPRGRSARKRRRLEEVEAMETEEGQGPKPSSSSPGRRVSTLPAGIMDSPKTQPARRSLRSQEDQELLGPLPINKRLFRGCAFILTAAPRDKAERVTAAAESVSSEDSEEEVSTLPFSKSHVQRQIEVGGGKVYEDFKRMQERSKSTHLYLIADSFCRTKKYFLSLAHGIPCVSHQWIRDSCSQGHLQDYKAYLLPAGRSLETRQVIEWQPRARIFQNMSVLVVSESRDFRDVWADILVAAGCNMAKKLSKEEAENAPLDGDLVVSDPSCPGGLVQRARQLGLSVVSTEWVIQCLIHAYRVEHTAHAKYRHDFTDS